MPPPTRTGGTVDGGLPCGGQALHKRLNRAEGAVYATPLVTPGKRRADCWISKPSASALS